MKNIIVNGETRQFAQHQISYIEVIALAEPGAPSGAVRSVTYRKGYARDPEGVLWLGKAVRVRDGMIFNVARTDNA